MKIPFLLHCSAALLLLMLFFSPAKQVGCQALPASCCLETSNTLVRMDLLKAYKEQKQGICPVHAIIFATRKNIRICSDPTSPWTIKAKNFLDKKKQPAVKPKRPSYHTTALKPEAPPQSNSTTINGTTVSL